MSRTWKEVWASRSLDSRRGSTLAQLMAADGLDTGFGEPSEGAWRNYVLETSARLGIAPPSSVFEVGCGAGAYLWELYRTGCEIGGLDASATLLAYGRQFMPRGRFTHAEASDLAPGERHDFVISNGVFLYFPSLAYAREVLDVMVRKARRGVMVLDVPDEAKRDEALAIRRRWIGEAEYEARYEGLQHLYFDRNWFERALTECGAARVRIEDQRIDGYANAKHRFNVFGWLPD
jgi:trans-aconitate methyltransferase